MESEKQAQPQVKSSQKQAVTAVAERSPIQLKSKETSPLAGSPPPASPIGGSDNSLPSPLLGKMNRSFGRDFSGVNIHRNSSRATGMNALAFTQGNDVHFAPGQYRPENRAGQELIGHELAHVVQQRNGGYGGIQAKGGNILQDMGLEREADIAGARAAEGGIISQNMLGIAFGSVQMKPGVEPEQPHREVIKTNKRFPTEKTDFIEINLDGDGDQFSKELYLKLKVNYSTNTLDVYAGKSGTEKKKTKLVLSGIPLANPEFLDVSLQIPGAGFKPYSIEFGKSENFAIQIFKDPAKSNKSYEFRAVNNQEVLKTGIFDDLDVKQGNLFKEVSEEEAGSIRNEQSGITKKRIYLKIGYYEDLYSLDFHKSNRKGEVKLGVIMHIPKGGWVKWSDFEIPIAGEFENLQVSIRKNGLYSSVHFNGSENPALLLYHRILPLYHWGKIKYKSTDKGRKNHLLLKIPGASSAYANELKSQKDTIANTSLLGKETYFFVEIQIRDGKYITISNPFSLGTEEGFLHAARIDAHNKLAQIPSQQDFQEILDYNSIKIQMELRRAYEEGHIPEDLYQVWKNLIYHFYGIYSNSDSKKEGESEKIIQVFSAQLKISVAKLVAKKEKENPKIEYDETFTNPQDAINKVDVRQGFEEQLNEYFTHAWNSLTNLSAINKTIGKISSILQSNRKDSSRLVNAQINNLTYLFGLQMLDLISIETLTFIGDQPLAGALRERDNLLDWMIKEESYEKETASLSSEKTIRYYPVSAYYYPKGGQVGSEIQGRSLSIICYLSKQTTSLNNEYYYWNILSYGDKNFRKYLSFRNPEKTPEFEEVHEELFALLDDDDFLPKGLVIYETTVNRSKNGQQRKTRLSGTVYLTEAKDVWEQTMATGAMVAAGLGTVLSFVPAPPLSQLGASIAFAVAGGLTAAGSVFKIMESKSETGKASWKQYSQAALDIMTAIGDVVGVGMAYRVVKGLKTSELVGTASGTAYKIIKTADLTADTVGFVMAEVEILAQIDAYLKQRAEAKQGVSTFEFWKLLSFAILNGGLGVYVGYTKGKDVTDYLRMERAQRQIVKQEQKINFFEARNYNSQNGFLDTQKVNPKDFNDLELEFQAAHPNKEWLDPEFENFITAKKRNNELSGEKADEIIKTIRATKSINHTVSSLQQKPVFYDQKLDFYEYLASTAYPKWLANQSRHGKSGNKSLGDFMNLLTVKKGKLSISGSEAGAIYSYPLFNQLKDLDFSSWDIKTISNILKKPDIKSRVNLIKNLKRESQNKNILELVVSQGANPLANLSTILKKGNLNRKEILAVRSIISVKDLPELELIKLLGIFEGKPQKLLNNYFEHVRYFPGYSPKRILQAMKEGAGNIEVTKDLLKFPNKLAKRSIIRKLKARKQKEIETSETEVKLLNKRIENINKNLKISNNNYANLTLKIKLEMDAYISTLKKVNSSDFEKELKQSILNDIKSQFKIAKVETGSFPRKKFKEKILRKNAIFDLKLNKFLKDLTPEIEKNIKIQKEAINQFSKELEEISKKLNSGNLASDKDILNFTNLVAAKIQKFSLDASTPSPAIFKKPAGFPHRQSQKSVGRKHPLSNQKALDLFQSQTEKYYKSLNRKFNQKTKNISNFDLKWPKHFQNHFSSFANHKSFFSNFETIISTIKTEGSRIKKIHIQKTDVFKKIAEKSQNLNAKRELLKNPKELLEKELATSFLKNSELKQKSISEWLSEKLSRAGLHGREGLRDIDVRKFILKMYTATMDGQGSDNSSNTGWSEIQNILKKELSGESFSEIVTWDEEQQRYTWENDEFDLSTEVESFLFEALFN